VVSPEYEDKDGRRILVCNTKHPSEIFIHKYSYICGNGIKAWELPNSFGNEFTDNESNKANDGDSGE
jgi:hypothetical protein